MPAAASRTGRLDERRRCLQPTVRLFAAALCGSAQSTRRSAGARYQSVALPLSLPVSPALRARLPIGPACPRTVLVWAPVLVCPHMSSYVLISSDHLQMSDAPHACLARARRRDRRRDPALDRHGPPGGPAPAIAATEVRARPEPQRQRIARTRAPRRGSSAPAVSPSLRHPRRRRSTAGRRAGRALQAQAPRREASHPRRGPGRAAPHLCPHPSSLPCPLSPLPPLPSLSRSCPSGDEFGARRPILLKPGTRSHD